MFEPATEVIRKGKAGKPNEFGEMLQVQEEENQIITAYEVYEKRPDGPRDLDRSGWRNTNGRLGRRPRLVAAGAGFSSAANEQALETMGVARVSIPNYTTRDPVRRGRQKQRWFKRGQKWRTGVEGRSSRTEAPPWTKPQPLPGPGRHAALGGAGGDRRQPDQHRDQARGRGVKLIGRAAGSALRGSNFRRFRQWESSEKAFLRRKVASYPADKHYVVRFRGT